MKEKADAPWSPNTDTLPFRGTSAGGGYSTVEDLFHFATALENHKLLDAEHTTLLLTGKADRPGGDNMPMVSPIAKKAASTVTAMVEAHPV